MRNFNKKITIIYILFIIYLLIGKVFIQNNLPQIYDNFYQPFFLIFLSFLSYKISKDTKKNNKYKGRKKIERPKNFIDIYNKWRCRELTGIKAMELLGVKKTPSISL